MWSRIATMQGFEGLPHVGKLPGDIVWRHGSFTFYFPIVTCLVLSGLISLVLWLLRK